MKHDISLTIPLTIARNMQRSVAVVETGLYLYHLRNLRPANLLRTQRINFSMRPHTCAWRATPLSFDVSFLENPTEYPHKPYMYIHRRRRRGQGGSCPPKIQEKYFSGKIHVKFGLFVNFSGKYHVKFGHFVNFSCIYFRAKMSCPPKLTELLRLCLYCQKLESLLKICTADNMCLSLLVFTQLFSEVAGSQPAKPARKQNLTRNNQSRSFK